MSKDSFSGMIETNAPRSISEPQIKNNGETAYATQFGAPTYQELTARLESMQKREAMLTDVLKLIDHVRGTVEDTQEVKEKINAALSATYSETEAWLQAEIQKRLGEPVGVVFFPAHRKAPDVEWSANTPISIGMKLYRLRSPLATPEERKD